MEIELLAEHCKQQTQRFFRKLESESHYCFELLTCACRDENEAAIVHIYQIYQPIMAVRAVRHEAFPDSCRDAKLLAYIALGRFYYAVRKENFLKKFQELSQVIAYMYRCLHTTILMDVRDNRRLEALENGQYVASISDNDEPKELIAEINKILSDEDDRLLLRLRFYYDMKPAEIAEQYPNRWASAREVSVAIQRIKRQLYANPDLRAQANIDSVLIKSEPPKNPKS